MSGEPRKSEYAPEKMLLEIRVGHFLRINSYLDYAIISMWSQRRAQAVMGMAEASVRGPSPGGVNGPDEKLLAKLRELIREAREYHAADNFPAAMARMRVADDLVSLYIVRLAGE